MFSAIASFIPVEAYLIICLVLLFVLIIVNAKRISARSRCNIIEAGYNYRLEQETKQLRDQISILQERLKMEDVSRVRELSYKNKTLEGEISKLRLELSSCKLENSRLSNSHAQNELIKLTGENALLRKKLYQHEEDLKKLLTSNLASIPWLAGMMADYLTYDIEMKAKYLDWGSDKKRLKKVEDIREIRAEAKARIQEAKEAVYQLEYIRRLFPAIDEILEADYQDLDLSKGLPEHDPTRDYLSKEEWTALSSAEKDQLALDRYVQSRSKSNWQIGRDYELAVAFEYRNKGYFTDTYGSYMGLEDLGRDIIAKSFGRTLIIQCKYWSQKKAIHEKHIFQLYGSLVTYRLDHPDLSGELFGVFITNTALSEMARKVADTLGISVVENHEMTSFPRIKCNIGRDEFGETHIYHLPMDAQYDIVQIKNRGEFYAFTVQEAIDAGFRRTYKWHGTGT